MKIGYALSSEEHAPTALVENAVAAEKAGFDFASISDHYHPWIEKQGESPFVWGVIGAIAASTNKLELITGVTCPIIRIHPALIAQAAATSAELMQGRFSLGLGTGENLNEHILGDRWPSAPERLAMLEEAIDILRLLWTGEEQTFKGEFFRVDHAKLYSLPDEPPNILVAAKGEKAADLASRKADGLIATEPDPDLVKRFEGSSGQGRLKYGMLHACWAPTEKEARSTAHEWWPNAAFEGELGVELPLPRHFEQAAKMVDEEAVAKGMIGRPDPRAHLDAIREFEQAGFTHVFVHQVGPDQKGFLDFYEQEVLPELKGPSLDITERKVPPAT